MWSISLLVVLVSAVCADKLSHNHLAPPGAATAGGYPGDLVVPFHYAHALNPVATTPIPIISYHNQPNLGDGSYSFSYETGNGIRANEEGVLKNEVPEGPGEAVQGAYSYTGPDGVLYSVSYTADEQGFLPRGDHLPTPPPIPPEILAALQQNAAEEAAAGPTPAPAQVGYFKSLPVYNPVYNHYNHNQRFNKYFKGY